MRVIDISVALRNGLVVWPSDAPVRIERKSFVERNGANVTEISLSSHTGTHVDPPLHFIAGGRSIDQLPPDLWVGPADVADFPGVERITAADLEHAGLPTDCRRLLLRTRNSQYWRQDDTTFHQDYAGISEDAAHWIVERGIRLIGIDYLSIEPYKMPGHPVHHTLLGAGLAILETINLSAVAPGRYQLICLPLLIAGGDGAPARALLVTEE